MKLIFLYGPPAVGKLTVAEQLSKQTGIAIFHNHHTRDLVQEIYGDLLEANYDLVDKLRMDVFKYCAQHDTDLIFTFVYGGVGENEDLLLRDYVGSVEDHGGKVEFVRLTAKNEDLLKRVNSESRSKYKKLLDPDTLGKFIESDRKISIPFAESLEVDTSAMESTESAKFIASELGLTSRQ